MHTKGEWIVKEEVDGHYSIFSDIAPEDKTVCVVWQNENEDAEANAHLIAAAPKLLEACNAWEKFISKLPKDFELQVFLYHLFSEAKELTEVALAAEKEERQ